MIQFLATYWWAFLIAAVLFGFLAGLNQVRRMKRMVGGFGSTFDDGFDGFTKGLGTLVLFGLLASVSTVLTVIGVVVAIINHVK